MSNQSSASSASIRVLVVDDQKMMRTILKDYINSADDIEVVGLAANGREGVDQALTLKPDVILMDIEMPDMDGLAATQLLKQSDSTTKVLVVSTSYEDRYLAQALRNGAMGYLLKTTSATDLVTAIRGVHAGNLQFGRDVLQRELWSATPSAQSKPKRVEILTSGIGGNGRNGASQRIAPDEERGLSTATVTAPTEEGTGLFTQEYESNSSVNLASELMQIRSGYWVLKTEMQTLRRWLGSLMIGIGVCICLTFIAIFL